MAVKLNWKNLENKCRKQVAQFWFLGEENIEGRKKGREDGAKSLSLHAQIP